MTLFVGAIRELAPVKARGVSDIQPLKRCDVVVPDNDREHEPGASVEASEQTGVTVMEILEQLYVRHDQRGFDQSQHEWTASDVDTLSTAFTNCLSRVAQLLIDPLERVQGAITDTI
jgi:hypothetical protein